MTLFEIVQTAAQYVQKIAAALPHNPEAEGVDKSECGLEAYPEFVREPRKLTEAL